MPGSTLLSVRYVAARLPSTDAPAFLAGLLKGPGLTGLPHAFATRMSIGPDSASIRRRIFSTPAKLVRSARSCIAWPPAGPLTEAWRPEQPGAMLVLEAADLAEAGAVAAGLPLASAAQVTADLIPLHLQTA